MISSRSPNSLEIRVPDRGWTLRIVRIWDSGTEITIAAELSRKPGPAAQIVTLVAAPIPITLPAKPVSVYVAGKSWTWPNTEPYRFVASLEPILSTNRQEKLLYPAAATPPPNP